MIKKSMDEVFLILDLDASTEKNKFKALRKVLSHVVAKNLKIYTGGFTEEGTVEETGGYVETAIRKTDHDNQKSDQQSDHYFKPDIEANLQLVPYIEPDTKKDYLRVKASEFIINEDACYFVDAEKESISNFYLPYYYTYCEENDILNLKDKIDNNQLYEKKSDYETLPSYLDPENPLYAEELALAIELHKAIYEEKYGNQSMSREDRIAYWVGKNKPELKSQSQAMLTRLSAIIRIN